MSTNQLVDYFQRVRKEPLFSVIEGVQALKHAARFGAELEQIISSDLAYLRQLLHELAPDVEDKVLSQTQEVNAEIFARLSPQPPRTKAIAIAKRRAYTIADIDQQKPIVFLEEPRDLENIGAVIRVAAAANAGAVIVSGNIDIWHPAIIRGAAGLHYAVPCFSDLQGTTLETVRMLSGKQKRFAYALDADDARAQLFDKKHVSNNAVLIFGSERAGVSRTLIDSADGIIKLPMQDGVSSLNLATSVAATLYMM